jgi:tetratricopeptide (TPR) repeat protein
MASAPSLDSPRDTAWRSRLAACAGSCALALLVRLAHLHAVSKTPFFAGLVVDAAGYAQDAASVLAEGTMPEGFYRPPLYAYVRAGLSLCGLGGPWGIGICQALAGSAVAGLLSLVSWHLVSPERPTLRAGAAWVGGVCAALYGPLVVYDLENLPPVWVNLLFAFAYYLSVVNRRNAVSASDFVAGVCIGLATTGWPPALLLAIPLLLLRSVDVSGTRRRSLALVFCLGAALGPSATAVHNARHDAPGILVSGNMGINLWLGNNPNWRQTSKARPGLAYDLEFQRATRAGALRMPERERFYLDAVASEVRSQPLQALGRTILKLLTFVHGRENSRIQDLEYLRQESPVARVLLWEWGLMFPFGLLLPLAVVCPPHVPRRYVSSIVLGGCLLYLGAVSLFLVAARYRLPVVLLLIPLAAAAMSAAMAEPGLYAGRRGALFTGMVVLLSLPVRHSSSWVPSQADRLRLLAEAHVARGEPETALEQLQRALELAPSDAAVRMQLGDLLLWQGDPAAAARQFYRAGELVPESEAPWVSHGHAMVALRRFPDAIYNYRQALRRNGFQREALRDLSLTYLRVGDSDRAVETFARFQAAGYRDEALSYQLARFLVERGKGGQAATILRDLLREGSHSEAVKTLLSRARESTAFDTAPRP